MEDFDRAKADEVTLWREALQDIAAGAGDPKMLAAAALQSLMVRFPR